MPLTNLGYVKLVLKLIIYKINKLLVFIIIVYICVSKYIVAVEICFYKYVLKKYGLLVFLVNI